MRLAIVLSLIVACSTTATKPKAPPANTSERSVAPEVTLAVGRMTFVMDSPEGQRDKAEAAVRSSELAAQLAALGYRVQISFDETAGDDVIARTSDGAELGRVALFELSRGNGGEPIVAAARMRLAPR